MRRGFTLIELLAAVAILAVVSVMAVQILGGAMAQRDRLGARDDQAAALALALALMRRDLEAIAPLAAEAEDLRPVAALIQRRDDGVSFDRAGLLRPDGAGVGQTARITWSLRGGVLSRQVETNGGDEAPQPVLSGVDSFALAPFAPGDDTLLPAPGYEVRLETRDWGPIRLVVAR